MKNSLLMVGFALFSTLFVTQSLHAKDAFYIGSGSGFFAEPSLWQDGYVPQYGDTAVLLPSGSASLTVPSGSPFTLASILLNTNGANYSVNLYGEINTLIAPALIAVSNSTLNIFGTLAGSDGFTFVGENGNLYLSTTNLITGPISLLSGRVLVRYDESFGPVPALLDPAALTLDGGTLGNATGLLTIAPTRGITAGPNGACFSSRIATTGSLDPGIIVSAPITGVGAVKVVRQAAGTMLSNPANDYAGDTIFGEKNIGAYFSAAIGYSYLTLGADEVIPDTSNLVFPNGHDGLLNLKGHSETVKGIVASNSVFAIENINSETPGILHTPIPYAPMNASIGAGVTLDLTGPGMARFNDTVHSQYLPSAGTLALSSGTLAFSDPARLGAVTLVLNDADLLLENQQPGLAEYRYALTDGNVDTNALEGTFLGVFPVLRWADADIPHALAFGLDTQYLYEGEWYVPADNTYSFGKAFESSACLIIDGQTLICNNTASAVVIKKDVFLTAGWHTIRVYLAYGGGTYGYVGALAAHGFVSGILYDPANGDITNGLGLVENAYPFADPGDGSVLRTLAPSATVTARARLEINSDATFDRSAAPGTDLVWAADVVSAPGTTLTITGGSEPFTVGSPNRPAVFDADISNANGIFFQDKVWLKKLPNPLDYGANTEFAAGVPGILGTGAQTLSDYSLRVPTADALGDPSAAPITVNTGRSLTFDSTTELNSRLIDDPDRAFTASNTVTLAGGTLAFDGPGAVTLDAPVSGSGNISKLGSGAAVLAQPATFAGAVTVANGTLTVLDDAALGNASNPIALTGGTLDLAALSSFTHDLSFTPESSIILPEAPITLSGVLAGTLNKTGPAPLTIAGNAPNSAFDLYVSDGDVTLANNPGPTVRNLLGVDADASVKLGGANQISGSACLSGGTLDLSGHDLTVKSLLAYEPSLVTNSASSTATLTVGTDNTDGILIGAIAPGVAFEKQGNGKFTLAALPGTSAPASVDVTAGTLALGRAPYHVRLTILKTRTPGQKPRIGEIVFTRNGYPIPYRTDVAATASSAQAPYLPAGAVDGSTSDFWLADNSENQYIIVSLNEWTIFDGYRLYSSVNVSGKASQINDPVSWRLEISRDSNTWLLIDAVEDADLYTTNPGNKIYECPLDPAAWPSIGFDAATPVHVANGATLQAASLISSVDTLSGAGTFEFLRGSSAILGDLSAFTGTYTGAGEMTIAGTAPFDIPTTSVPPAFSGRLYGISTVNFPPEFPTIHNVATPATVLVGASGADGSFAGRLAEAAAPLGLTKVGAGKTTLVDAGSAYNGDTTIESGTLAVNAGSYKFRYVKFDVTAAQNDGIDPYGYELCYAEFELLHNGQPIVWPSGTTATAPNTTVPSHAHNVPANAIDGDINSRWLTGPLQALTIDTQSSVIFDTYRFYQSGKEVTRCPKTWTVEGSDDGVNWSVIDSQSNYPPLAAGQGTLVGTFQLRNHAPRAWLPGAFYGETSATNPLLSSVAASKFCFQVLGVRKEDSSLNYGCNGYALTELTLLRNNEVVPWPAGTTAWSPIPGWELPLGEPANLVNNDEVATGANRFYSSTLLNHVVITTPTNLSFDAYRWITANNFPNRDPIHWRLMVNSGEAAAPFYLVDEQVNYPTPSTLGAMVGPFPIQQSAGLSAVDAISDTSRLRIARGATLEIGGNTSETVGPLSGTGTVALATGATLGLNLFEDAVFDGTISGHGTLALAGDHGQFFTSANTISSDFAVDFRGGKFGGTLHVGGALTVTGDVRYALPEGTEMPYHRTLFTYDSIDTDSRAALIAGASSIPAPAGMDVKVTVTDTSAALSINAPGTIILVR